MTIGELAQKAGVNVQTVYYYERAGVLPEAHRWPDSGYRDFDDDALQRLRFVRSAKELGFTLREIKELLELRVLPRESCVEVRGMIRAKLADLDLRMKELRRLRRALVRMEAACRRHTGRRECPTLWALER